MTKKSMTERLITKKLMTDKVGHLHECGVTNRPSEPTVGSSSFSHAEVQMLSPGPASFCIPVDNNLGFCNEERKDCHTPTFLHCIDQTAQDSPVAQTHIVPYSGVGIGPTTAAGSFPCYDLSASKSRSLELDMAGQVQQAQQVEDVRELEAECDRLDTDCGKLEVELHRMRTALVQAQVRFMEETVKREDFSVHPCCPVLTQTQTHSTLSPMQVLDAAVSYLPSHNGTASAVVRSIPRKRRYPESDDDDAAYARKRRRCG